MSAWMITELNLFAGLVPLFPLFIQLYIFAYIYLYIVHYIAVYLSRLLKRDMGESIYETFYTKTANDKDNWNHRQNRAFSNEGGRVYLVFQIDKIR